MPCSRCARFVQDIVTKMCLLAFISRGFVAVDARLNALHRHWNVSDCMFRTQWCARLHITYMHQCVRLHAIHAVMCQDPCYHTLCVRLHAIHTLISTTCYIHTKCARLYVIHAWLCQITCYVLREYTLMWQNACYARSVMPDYMLYITWVHINVPDCMLYTQWCARLHVTSILHVYTFICQIAWFTRGDVPGYMLYITCVGPTH